MPHMAPMFWTFISLLCSLSILLICIMLYFWYLNFKQNKISPEFFTKNTKKLMW